MNRIQQIVLAAGLLVVATTGLTAGDVQLTSVLRNIPERGQVAGAQIQAGAWNASFIVPAGWRMGKSGAKVVLQPQDFSARIELSLNSLAMDKEPSKAGDEARSRVVRKFDWPTPLGQGSAVEKEQATPENFRLLTHQIRVPQPEGTLEITLVSSPEKYAQHQKAFRNLAASLRAQ